MVVWVLCIELKINIMHRDIGLLLNKEGFIGGFPSFYPFEGLGSEFFPIIDSFWLFWVE